MTDYDEQSVQIAVTVKGQADAEKALEQAKALLDQFHPKAQVGDIVLVRDDLPHVLVSAVAGSLPPPIEQACLARNDRKVSEVSSRIVVTRIEST